MQAPGLSRQAAARPARRLTVASAIAPAIAIATVLLAALVVWVLAPGSWQSLIADEQRTDASVLTVISIWANNLLICCLPILAGVFAHRLTKRDRRGWARLVISVAALAVTRSLLVIGLVGGLDPRWLASAAAWWILEVSALGVCCAAGWHAFRSTDSAAVSKRLAHALRFACVVLAVGAVVEVVLT